MSWQSTPSGERWIERDDEPLPARTIPEKPQVGQRFMQAAPFGSWDVFDWEPASCYRCGGSGSAAPFVECQACKGSGCEAGAGPGGMTHEPVALARDLVEKDARLLVFGGELVCALAVLLHETDQGTQLCGRSIAERAQRALENVRQILSEQNKAGQ